MSFEIHLQTFNLTGEMVEFVDPFTGGLRSGRTDLGVNESERKAIVEYLESVSADGLILETYDGGHARVCADDLRGQGPFTGCSFSLRSPPTPMLAEAIWQVANLGRMIILVTMQDEKPVATHEDHLQNVPTDLEPVVCESPKLLDELLKRGFDDWVNHRRQVFDL